MSKPTQHGNVKQWVCRKLAPFYPQTLKPADLLAIKQVHRDVVVIGPDGRKFRLQVDPDMQVEKEEAG